MYRRGMRGAFLRPRGATTSPSARLLLRPWWPSASSAFSSSSGGDVQAYAKEEVRKARRRQREEEDEICLFNAAWRAAKDTLDAFDASEVGSTREGRLRAIDTHVARQVALLLGSLFTPGFTPGVPPPGMTYAIEVRESTIPDADKYDPSAVEAAVAKMARSQEEGTRGGGDGAAAAEEQENGHDERGTGGEKHWRTLAMAVPGGAGRGLIIRGSASAGDVVAFYPGTVYRSEDVRWCGGYGAMLERAQSPESADYMLGRRGFVIDGLGSSFDLAPEELRGGGGSSNADADEAAAAYVAGLEARDAAAPPLPPAIAASESSASSYRAGLGNAWANGHFANHPPRGRRANVVGWPYDFPAADALPERILPLIPNAYAARTPIEGRGGGGSGGGGDAAATAAAVGTTRTTICPHTIVLVAARDLEDGEEAFLDYGFEQAAAPSADGQQSRGVPDWFFPARLRGDTLVEPDEEYDDDDDDDDDDEEEDKAVGDASTQKKEKRRGKKKKKAVSPRDAAYNALMEWKAEYAAAHGGKAPGVAELMGDPTARALFQEFSKHNPLEWDEGDMEK